MLLPGRSALPGVPGEEGALNAGGEVQQVHLLQHKEDVTWQVRAPPGPGRGAGSECWRAGAAGPPRRGPGPGAQHGLPAGPLNHQSSLISQVFLNRDIYCDSGPEFGKVPVRDQNSHLD
jgi:hypothetical protein